MPRNIGDAAWDGLIALFGATLDQCYEFPACLLLGGVIVRRGRHEPIDVFDIGSVALLLLLIGILVRRVMHSHKRSVDGFRRVPKGTEAPTASWAHFVWAACWFWVARGLWTVDDAELHREYLGIGPGFAIVGGALLLLRTIYIVKRWRVE